MAAASRARWALPAALALAVGAALVLADVAGVAARQTDADFGGDDGALSFRHVNVEQGLPSAVILAITQDALGFVWIGTDEGLARYDGVDVREYKRTADSTSLSGNVVQVLAPGADGVVWAGTGSGLSRYSPASNTFLRVSALPSNDIRALVADSVGGVWVGTASGLAYAAPIGSVDFVEGTADGLPEETVEALYLDGGDVWVGTGNGLARRNPDGSYDRFQPDSLGLRTTFRVSVISASQDGLWVGTFGDGLFRFSPDTGQFESVDIGGDLIAKNVTDVYEDGSGTTWVATLGGGLHRLSAGAPPRIYRSAPEDLSSLSGDEISALMEDRQGVLWVATYSGLDRFDRARGTAVRLRHDPEDPTTLASNEVRAVMEASNRTLWVGTDAGLSRSTDGRTFRHSQASSSDRATHPVRSLAEGPDGTIWVGSEGAGLFRTSGTEGLRPVELPDAQGRARAISALHSDEDGTLWIGTLSQGLGQYTPSTGEARFLRSRDSDLPSDQVRAIVEDVSGALWIGTDDGLCRLDAPSTGRFTCIEVNEADPTALSDGFIHSLHARPNGMLWVGTRQGLHRINTRDIEAGVRRYRVVESDLPGDAVYAIVEDEDGYLWLSTSGGLARFEPITEIFSRRAGAGGDERTLTAAADRGPNGRLYFGSTRGLLAFYPQQLASLNPNPPQVAITGVAVAGQPVEPGGAILTDAAPVAEQIELSHDAAYLTIQYAGLHFSAPAQNTYRYRLVGLYDEWREAGTVREATYPTLPPGRYTFEVQAANADGVGFGDDARAAQASIDVIVNPPWWRRWWAIALFAIVGLAALVRVDRWQRARLLRQERERAERREAELRAETAEAEQREAQAEAVALKAENDRKAAELERTREVEAANAKLEKANERLESSLRDLRQTQTQLVQSEKLASLGQLTAGIAHEIKNPLNFVNNFADLSVELADELRTEMAEAGDRPTGEVLSEVGDLLDDLQENARRIREHGQRADRIVRSMLLHSRGGSAERGRVEINRFVDEYANLAFHGARANDSDFQVEIVRDFAEDAGEVEIVPQEFGRVLINLLTNAFHAVVERGETESRDYAPTVTVRTRRVDSEVVVEIADNGTGIPEAVKAKIFEPFFTTKPTGQGTGLGLSLAHDIVAQVHGGRMSVDSTEGEGTTFEIVLPDRAPDADGA